MASVDGDKVTIFVAIVMVTATFGTYCVHSFRNVCRLPTVCQTVFS